MKKLNLAIFGCGDFLRWQADAIKKSTRVNVAALFDPDGARARKYAGQLGGKLIVNGDDIFADSSIDAVALFVPPWIRKGLFLKAAAAGKHAICTKPFGSTAAECEEMLAAAGKAGIKAGILYGRSADAWFETVKDLLADGRHGKLALYRQDWIHAYPQWNNWATDPKKNGGPFMDAMIHNLNAACYLMGRPVAGSAFFSDRLAHPDMKCADTEAMIVNFEGGGVANLFITWAADLATHSRKGNDREHIDLFYLVTDKGYRITRERSESGPLIVVSREGRTEKLPCAPLAATPYDAFAAHVDGGTFPRVMATLAEATRDITLVRRGRPRGMISEKTETSHSGEI
ncbi:MAG: Gfo/Idh/MocA family oxidoreductase [Opitutaceae bacterium]|nr:Gfo/Idh/MocA family oxidoreductase [Opitutaceae bacterium]